MAAWLKCFNPTWQPQGIPAAAVNAAGGRMQSALPRNLDSDVGVLALEVAGTLGAQAGTLGPTTQAWANRVAFFSTGDPNAALDAIAVAEGGGASGAPTDPAERVSWIVRTPEAHDLIAFGVTDAFAEALGLGFEPRRLATASVYSDGDRDGRTLGVPLCTRHENVFPRREKPARNKRRTYTHD